MNLSKVRWIVAVLLLAVATLTIHYQIKVRMHVGTGFGAVGSLGRVSVGDTAPEFVLEDLAKQQVALSSYRGKKVVLLDFWATWCGPCRMAMPGLQKLHEDLQAQGIELVSVDQQEDGDRVRSFIDRKKYTFTTLLDRDGAVGHSFGVRALPTLVVVDKRGVVRRLQVGMTMDDKELRKFLLALAEES